MNYILIFSSVKFIFCTNVTATKSFFDLAAKINNKKNEVQHNVFSTIQFLLIFFSIFVGINGWRVLKNVEIN
jgi:hypothetical protein